jgi:hypothetical protein
MSYKIILIQMFAIYYKREPDSENTRGLNLAAVKPVWAAVELRQVMIWPRPAYIMHSKL